MQHGRDCEKGREGNNTPETRLECNSLGSPDVIRAPATRIEVHRAIVEAAENCVFMAHTV